MAIPMALTYYQYINAYRQLPIGDIKMLTGSHILAIPEMLIAC